MLKVGFMMGLMVNINTCCQFKGVIILVFWIEETTNSWNHKPAYISLASLVLKTSFSRGMNHDQFSIETTSTPMTNGVWEEWWRMHLLKQCMLLIQTYLSSLMVGSWGLPYPLWLSSGWWFFATPLKNDGVKVSWDDDIPSRWKNNPNVPNHQPVIYIYYIYI